MIASKEFDQELAQLHTWARTWAVAVVDAADTVVWPARDVGPYLVLALAFVEELPVVGIEGILVSSDASPPTFLASEK